MDSSSPDNATMGACSSHQTREAPRRCARGCGFFGTAENRGFCSKCYTDYLKEKMAKSESAMPSEDQLKISSIPTQVEIGKFVDALKSTTITDINTSVSAAPPVVKNRCGCCKKKLGLLGFECRCGGKFCGIHRYPEAHPCQFDFKIAGKMAIEKENPVCKSDKITDRV